MKILKKLCVGIPFFVFTVIFFDSYKASAEDNRGVFFLEVGVIGQNMGRLSNAPTGEPSLLSALYTDFALSAQLAMNSTWSISPFVGYTPLRYKSADEGEKSTLMPIALRLEMSSSSAFIHMGPGILIYSVSGTGGTTTLNNGTGNAVFGLPSDSQSSKLFMLDVGGGISAGRFRLGIDAFVTGLLSSQRRAVNCMLNLGYALF